MSTNSSESDGGFKLSGLFEDLHLEAPVKSTSTFNKSECDSSEYSYHVACKFPNHKNLSINTEKSRDIRNHWRSLSRKAVGMHDPWESYALESLPTETATRYRLHPTTFKFVEDEVSVKIAGEKFAEGAMRYCYRLKKGCVSPNDPSHPIWKYNYVAKKYIECVDEQVYFDDVKLQMLAKVLSREYNEHNPPKKVDMMQVAIIRFRDRPGQPLYHLEHYIEGEYIKYNSNSGFVDDEVARCTPHAFSHFTFERSSHEFIVVDIQGVGDLYTDPQLHTASGLGFGDGNLGPKGMALFFHSHACNRICKALDLVPFDLHTNETDHQKQHFVNQSLAKTVARTTDHHVVGMRCASSNSESSLNHSISEWMSPLGSPPISPYSPDEGIGSPLNMAQDFWLSRDHIQRQRAFSSECSYDEFPQLYKSGSHDAARSGMDSVPECAFLEHVGKTNRGSNVANELDLRLVQNKLKSIGGSILGQIHLELAKYHECGRFSIDGEPDVDLKSAKYHLKHSASLGCMEAVIALSRVYLGMANDVLPNIVCEQTEKHMMKGFLHLEVAAAARDRRSMILLAKALHKGTLLPAARQRDWLEAVHFYEEASINLQEDEGGEYDAVTDDPVYLLLAARAEMFRTGGHHLPQDLATAAELYAEAAEASMAAMKGKMANKYYALSEECYAEAE